MYSTIMVPVDLAHADRLDKALQTAAHIAASENATVLAAGVTTSQPSAVAHNIDEFKQKLTEFAETATGKYGVPFTPVPLTGHDPVRDLDDVLMKSIDEHKVDLVVMASHIPGVASHVFSSNAGYLASHAPVSVCVVR